MRPLTEKQIKNRIKKELGQYTKRFWYMPGPSSYTTMDGQPDFIVVWKGVFIGIEVKGPSYKQSSVQRLFQKRLIEAGGIYLIINSRNAHKIPRYLKLLKWLIGKKYGLQRFKKNI